jgi:hypothetical protein
LDGNRVGRTRTAVSLRPKRRRSLHRASVSRPKALDDPSPQRRHGNGKKAEHNKRGGQLDQAGRSETE